MEVRDGSGHPDRGPGRVGTPFGRSRTGRDSFREVRNVRDTLMEVRDLSGHPEKGPARVGTSSGRFGKGRDTLWDVRDGSELPLRGPGQFGTH